MAPGSSSTKGQTDPADSARAGLAAYCGNQPSQTGEDRSPPSNMTQTLSPTGGVTTFLLLSYAVQGVAQPVAPGASRTVRHNRHLPCGSAVSITVPRYMRWRVALVCGRGMSGV